VILINQLGKIEAFRTKNMTSDHRSQTKRNNPIKTIMTELENAYSYQRYGFMPLDRFSLYFLLSGKAMEKCAKADIKGNDATMTPR
jgi:plastocyanin domain-containing protein